LASCYVENLLEEDIEIGFKDLITVEEDQEDREFTNEDRHKYHESLIESFEGMNNCFVNAAFNSEQIDYELDKKMQVFTNLAIMLARLYEFKVKNDDAVRVCDILLQKSLPPHLRKTFDSIKARVTK